MPHDTVTLEYVDEGHIAVVRLNRPQTLNALDRALAADLSSVIDELGRQAALRAVVVAGNGKAFCAGGDLATFQTLTRSGQSLEPLAAIFHERILTIRALPAPFIAAIHGACFGFGLALACVCDLRLASPNATFSVAFTGVGLSPDSGLPWFLPRIVGLGVATELALLNPIIDAQRAKEINLITAISSADVSADAMALARTLAALPTQAVGRIKQLYNDAYGDTLAQHLDKQARYVGATSLSEDFQEGCAAFFERRKPVFKGK